MISFYKKNEQNHLLAKRNVLFIIKSISLKQLNKGNDGFTLRIIINLPKLSNPHNNNSVDDRKYVVYLAG